MAPLALDIYSSVTGRDFGRLPLVFSATGELCLLLMAFGLGIFVMAQPSTSRLGAWAQRLAGGTLILIAIWGAGVDLKLIPAPSPDHRSSLQFIRLTDVPVIALVFAPAAILALAFTIRYKLWALWELPSLTAHEVSARDIPRVLAALSSAPAVSAFATFVFNPLDRPDPDDVVNVQFSIEEGRPGFDWCLLAPQNIKDESRFVDFVRAGGYVPERKEANDIVYWRVENGDLARLCHDVVTEIYGLADTDTLGLVVSGFDWRPSPGSQPDRLD